MKLPRWAPWALVGVGAFLVLRNRKSASAETAGEAAGEQAVAGSASNLSGSSFLSDLVAAITAPATNSAPAATAAPATAAPAAPAPAASYVPPATTIESFGDRSW